MSQINNYELMWILSSEEPEESQEEIVSILKIAYPAQVEK